MAFVFGDGFDCYAAPGDTLLGYWDGGSGGAQLVAGRFAGSQAINLQGGGVTYLIKSSGVNDGVHHIVCAVRQTAVLSGTSAGGYLQFSDGATNQCCIVFRSDGAILLTSATATGTTLATYAGAVSAQNTWFAFEFEVVIHPTAGAFRARKNGNTSNDFDSGATLNTRPGTNSYANKITLGMSSTVNAQQFDDILWRSDASSVPWVGDIRAYTRMPAADVTAVFSRSPSPASVSQTAAASGTTSKAANNGCMSAFTAAFSGTIGSGTVSINTGATGNMKAAIYDSTRTTVLATSNAVVNPGSGSVAITFGTPLTVTKGTVYHLAVDQDATIIYTTTSANQWSFTTAYASFPAASPTLTAAQAGPGCTLNITPTISSEFVNETLQDGTTSYVYDSNVGDADFYSIAALSGTPSSTVCVTTRGFVQKSDAGTRNGAVQLKSGGTTVTSTSTALSTSWGWLYRTDLTDPATGSAWSATGVNNVTIGPVVTL